MCQWNNNKLVISPNYEYLIGDKVKIRAISYILIEN